MTTALYTTTYVIFLKAWKEDFEEICQKGNNSCD
jgi:hypothetical protein